MTGELRTVDGRSVLRMERRLAHPPERVWGALTESARLADWFPDRISIELRPGGAVTYSEGEPGVVTDLDPPRLIAWTWDSDHLRFELHPDGEGTRLVLTHTFDDRAGAASFAAGWHGCLEALDGTPEGDHEARHEYYLAHLGLLDATVADTAQGWQVRLERQLLFPAERVWPVLVATADGPVRESREAEVLEHDVDGGGRARWELRPGTGHGARLLLVRSGPPGTDVERERALAEAPARVGRLLDALS